MKIINVILSTALVVGSIPVVAVPEAKAADYMCLQTKGGTFFVDEKITPVQAKFLDYRPYWTQDQVNTYLLTTSVKNKFPSCLNQSNTFVGFDRAIKRNLDYVYTARYSQIVFVKGNRQTIKLNKKLIITVKFQKASPALIEVTTQYQPPLVNGG
jgi:hypothetical protein